MGWKEMEIIMLFLLNALMQLKVAKMPLDHDTSNHLYSAFLKGWGIDFLQSYRLGVKYFMPRVYRLLLPLLRKDIYYFRTINFLATSFLLTIFVLMKKDISSIDMFFYLIMILSINSLWVNYTKSASEFLEVPCILVAFLLPLNLWWLSFGIIILCSGLFKITTILYFIPLLFRYFELSSLFSPGLLFLIAIVVLLSLVFFMKNMSKILSYSKSRKIFNRKNLKFIALNIIPLGLLSWLVVLNFNYTDILGKVLLTTTICILFVQRSYTGYLFYPLVAISFFVTFRSDWTAGCDPKILSFVLIYIVGFSLYSIILRTTKSINRIWRVNVFGDRHWPKYIEQREQDVLWLKENIPEEASVYLWGTHVYLLLSSRLRHVGGTYYNHNFLCLWSNIEDKKGYVLNVIREKKPAFIIVSLPMPQLPYDSDELDDSYQKIYGSQGMEVYKYNG